MATIERPAPTRPRAASARIATLALLILATPGGGCAPAQIGPDADTFKAVDALYTAVSLRDRKLIEGCEKSLADLRTQKKLPDAAGKSLDAFIAEARAEKWEDAQRKLADFMRGQRR